MINLASQLPYAAAVICFALALAAALRAGRFLDRWAFVVGMTALAAEAALTGVSAGVVVQEDMTRWQRWILLAGAFVTGPWLFFSWSYSRDTERKHLSLRFLPWLVASAVLPAWVGLFWEGLFGNWLRAGSDNTWVLGTEWTATALQAVALIGAVAVLMNLEATFRASVGTMRWRIKYMILGVGLLFVARLYTSSQALLFRAVDPALATVNSAATVLGCLLILRSIFRDGHFGLQVYPSQSVLQSSLTVLLAGIYFLIVGVLAKVVSFFGGDSTFALKTFLIFLSLVLLALLLQSDRIRTGVRQFVSRHLSRPLYDYREVWRKFNEGTSTSLDQPGLCRSLAKVVADVSQALSVTIWLVDEARGTVSFGASTSRTEDRAADLAKQQPLMASVIHYFHKHGEPVEFETVGALWAETLRAWHPTEFANGGTRACVPIRRQGELVGLITVGDRVGGAAYSAQDFDLFSCIAEHVAASLLNLQLSQQLLQAKELESFQKMAAFFVHDLKNAAATLSLMLKNLPVHFDDPEFRQDALRGIGKTVARINELTGRLNTLRHDLKLNLVEADVNELIRLAVAAVPLGPEIRKVEELKELPRVRLDREQMGKVLLNLLLNAGEAMSGPGEVRVASDRAEGWVTITVADTGCGMSAEFLNRSLFRPFQTTKTTGLGIGMFQCKAIVEAHGGRIAVTSEPGAGSMFQVFLPFATQTK